MGHVTLEVGLPVVVDARAPWLLTPAMSQMLFTSALGEFSAPVNVWSTQQLRSISSLKRRSSARDIKRLAVDTVGRVRRRFSFVARVDVLRVPLETDVSCLLCTTSTMIWMHLSFAALSPS